MSVLDECVMEGTEVDIAFLRKHYPEISNKLEEALVKIDILTERCDKLEQRLSDVYDALFDFEKFITDKLGS